MLYCTRRAGEVKANKKGLISVSRPARPSQMPTLYQIAYCTAFTQAFNHYLQTRGLYPQGSGIINGTVIEQRHIDAARDYARLQADLAVQQWEKFGPEPLPPLEKW